jgi:hypothetical protein
MGCGCKIIIRGICMIKLILGFLARFLLYTVLLVIFSLIWLIWDTNIFEGEFNWDDDWNWITYGRVMP